MWKIILSMVVGLVIAERITFDNYKVFQIVMTTDTQVKLLNQWVNENSDDFFLWKEPSVNKQADLMVAPQKLPEFYKFMAQIGASYKVSINNVQTLINQTATARASDTFNLQNYNTLESIYEYLDTLVKKHPGKVEIIKGGRSYENREIKGIKISFSKCDNPGIFFESGIHAREWIAPATVLYIVNELLTSTDRHIRAIAESHDWYIFPVCNPDGYVYTHTTNRLWRKTRKPYSDNCYGTDPNRNWGYTWQSGGNNSDPCNELYPGPKPFSDIETKSLSRYIKSICNKFYIYFSFHSYSQLLMFPYSYTTNHTNNYDDLYNISIKGMTSLARRYGTNYTIGQIAETIYEASGSSLDWVTFACGTRILFAYELRDQGEYGFLLPPEQIIPTGEETLDSILAVIKEAKTLGYS